MAELLPSAEERISQIALRQIEMAFAKIGIRHEDEYDEMAADLRWLRFWRKSLTSVAAKIVWLILAFMVFGVLAFISGATSEKFQRFLREEKNAVSEYPAGGR